MNQTQLRGRTHCTEQNLVTSRNACIPPPLLPLPQSSPSDIVVLLQCSTQSPMAWAEASALFPSGRMPPPLCHLLYLLRTFPQEHLPQKSNLVELLVEVLLSRSVTITVICKMTPSLCLVFHINGRPSPVDGLVSPAQSQSALKPVSTCCFSQRNTDLKSRMITALAQPRVEGVYVHITEKVSPKPPSPSFSSYLIRLLGNFSSLPPMLSANSVHVRLSAFS